MSKRPDLDAPFDPPTHEQLLGEIRGVALADNSNPDHGPYVIFRAVCGANGYFCSAGFRDPVGYGGGKTPRAAMRALAANLRATAERLERAADPNDVERRTCRACEGDGIIAADGHTPPHERVTRDSRRCNYCGGKGWVRS